METLLKKTKRKLHVVDDVLKTAPRGTTKDELTFFKVGKYVTDGELQTEYEKRNLVPATIEMLVDYDLKNPQKMDEMKYVGTHWKDADGNWCYAAFSLWFDGGRGVDVNRNDNDWSDDWLFCGIKKEPSSPQSLSALTLEQRVEALEKLVEKIKGVFIV